MPDLTDIERAAGPERMLTLETMNDDERRGFLFALNMLSTWTRQIESRAPAMAGGDTPIPLSLQMQNSAKFTRGLTDALARQAAH